MKTINKIALVQVSFFIGGITGYALLDLEFKYIIANHIVLTAGYLYGLWHGKN